MKKFKILLSAAFCFLANTDGVISLFSKLFDTHKKYKNMDTGNIIQIISIIITFAVAYYFLSVINNLINSINASNEHLFNQIDNATKELTSNLNAAYKTLDTKIRYVDFRFENRELDNDDFIKKLHLRGFSKEDLEDIGVDKEFLEKNNDKLLPRSVIEKFISFKIEFEKYNP